MSRSRPSRENIKHENENCVHIKIINMYYVVHMNNNSTMCIQTLVGSNSFQSFIPKILVYNYCSFYK